MKKPATSPFATLGFAVLHKSGKKGSRWVEVGRVMTLREAVTISNAPGAWWYHTLTEVLTI